MPLLQPLEETSFARRNDQVRSNFNIASTTRQALVAKNFARQATRWLWQSEAVRKA